ncbi:MAG: IS1182 family transposase [bacterium]|nr:IS1182 family transposase [bacterium]
MSLGLADRQQDLLDDVSWFCEEALPTNSIYSVLHRERDRLFPDEIFADLFSQKGRRSVPPSVVATVMVLQRLGGLSDREAVERSSFDTRWRYAAGVGGYGEDKWGKFAHTVLVDMRARLAASEAPRRIFEVTKAVASEAGLVGMKRVLDSTPLYDAVATMDALTLIRSAVRSLLRVADEGLEGELRDVLASGEDYATSAKPQIDWDDADAREQLIDSRVRDALACLLVLEGRALCAEVKEAAELLATVVGQDLEETEDGTYRIARRVAKDRVISTVDPEARHGHKSASQGFDGYKGHLALEPDSEIITQTAVTAGNAGDASVAADLIDDLVDSEVASSEADDASVGSEPEPSCAYESEPEPPKVYGDAAYGTGEFLNHLDQEGIESGCKTQPPSNRDGLFPKSHFQIDLDTETVTCPAEFTVPMRRTADGGGIASFAGACAECPLRPECTQAARGRSIRVGPHERHLAEARQRQQDPDWAADYRATRPKVERKIGHLMRRRHGGRRSRVLGQAKVDADFNLLAAAHNLARLAVLGIQWTTLGWVAEMA